MSVPVDSTLKTGFLTTENFLLHYLHKGSGPPLVLLHGGGTWLYSFRYNISPLAKNFSVYAFDVPGHGYSKSLKAIRKIYNFETVCRALLEFMNRMGLEKIHLAGHSWGGGWAVYFTDRFPNRVDKLVLIDSSGMHRYEKLSWELMKYPIPKKFLFRFLSEKTVIKELEACFYNKSRVDREMIQNIYAPFSDKNILHAQLSYSRNINWKKIQTALPRIRSKTLIVWGQNDRYINVRHGKRMHKQIPGSHLEIIDRCGHCPHEEHPDQVNRLIINFIKSDKGSSF